MAKFVGFDHVRGPEILQKSRRGSLAEAKCGYQCKRK